MSSGHKPKGYNAVSVYIVADGAQKVVDFLKKTFDAEELRRFDTPDGKIMHGEARIGDTVVMIAEGGGSYSAFPVWLHVYVPDVDATYKKALGAGANFGAGTGAQRRRSRQTRWSERSSGECLVDFDASRMRHLQTENSRMILFSSFCEWTNAQAGVREFLNIELSTFVFIEAIEFGFHKVHPLSLSDLSSFAVAEEEQQILNVVLTEGQSVLRLGRG